MSMSDTSISKHAAVMFSDIAGSTAIYDVLGDKAAEKCIRDSIAMMRDVVQAHGGTVVKTIGDELMCYFSSASDACLAAIDIQEASNNIMIDPLHSVQVRIGIHSGEVLEKSGDIFGDAVNVAARMTNIAKARQIIVSEDCVNELDENRQAQVRLFDHAHVKGKQQPIAIYQIVWEALNQTYIMNAEEVSAISSAKSGLLLAYEGKEILLSRQRATHAFVIGREASCDLMVNSDFASRSHLDISWVRGKFILTDHSTNGTKVYLASGESIFLKRESYPLIGKGRFTLGLDGKHLIAFEVIAE